MGGARTPTPKPSYFRILSIYNCKWSKGWHNTLSRQVHWWSPCRKSAKWCAEVRTLGLCNCDWPICISRIFFSRQIWQISEQYGLIDFLLYDSRISTNKKIFYYVSYNNKLAYLFITAITSWTPFRQDKREEGLHANSVRMGGGDFTHTMWGLLVEGGGDCTYTMWGVKKNYVG
jgi:hypothetical protein